MSILISHLIDDKINKIDNSLSYIFDSYESKCDDLKKNLTILTHKLGFNYNKPFGDKENNLKLALTKLEGLNPVSILLKGWASVEKDDARLDSIDKLKKNDKIRVNFKDGSIDAVVENIQQKKER